MEWIRYNLERILFVFAISWFISTTTFLILALMGILST